MSHRDILLEQRCQDTFRGLLRGGFEQCNVEGRTPAKWMVKNDGVNALDNIGRTCTAVEVVGVGGPA
jgi:hypothetical protein